MSTRVRFAPSPTGYLHIGGARTALYNYLYAKAVGGTFVLRVEDTDQERSRPEFEELQLEDLAWLGLEYDEGPGKEGDFGPYRQSERSEIYQKYAQQLLQEKKAFYCFCTEEELTKKKEAALAAGKDPLYDGTCHHLSQAEIESRLSKGEEAVVRFRVNQKAYKFKDHVRGEVEFPPMMVGDFVLLRSGGKPVYNFCCVVDDWLMKISHVIRGEDHLSNTLRQLMIYEALGAPVPEFAHVSLLVGKDRQKLSKRHGATSVTQYREKGYIPEAVLNYLCLLGWSHPDEETVFNPHDLDKFFTLNRFNKAPATFDLEKFEFINGQHLRGQGEGHLIAEFGKAIAANHEYHNKEAHWKLKFVHLFKDQVQFYSEITTHLDVIFSPHVTWTQELKEILAWETTPQVKEYLKEQVDKLISEGREYLDEETYASWATHLKKELKIKGKFLFMGMRGVLTGRGHGPDLKTIATLTKLSVISSRLEQLG